MAQLDVRQIWWHLFTLVVLISLPAKSLALRRLGVTVVQINGVLDKSAVLRCSYNMKGVHIYGVMWRRSEDYHFVYQYWNQKGKEFIDKAFNSTSITGLFRPELGYHDLRINRPSHKAEIVYHCELFGLLGTEETYGMDWHFLDLIVPPKTSPRMFAKEDGQHGIMCNQRQIPVVPVLGNWVLLVCHSYASKPSGLITWNRGTRHDHVNTTDIRDGKDDINADTVNVTRKKSVAMETVRCEIEGPNVEGEEGKTTLCLILAWKEGDEAVELPTIIHHHHHNATNTGLIIGLVLFFAVIFLVFGLVIVYLWRKPRHQAGL